MEIKQPARKNTELRPTDEFVESYANHVFMEPSFWDLKLIFGQLDQSVEPLIVHQHTAITVPWAQVKIMIHFLRVQLYAFEAAHGKVALSQAVLPPPPTAPTEEMLKQGPHAAQIFEEIKKLNKELRDSA